MKKFVLILFLLMAMFGSAAAQTCDCGDLQAQVDTLSDQLDQLFGFLYSQYLGPLTPAQGSSDMVVKSGSFDKVTIGDFAIGYSHAVIRKTNFHASVILISLSFYNDSSETVRFTDVIRMKAFQDGVGLREYYTNNQGYLDLRPGKSVNITKTYILQNNDSPIEFEIAPIRSGQDPEIRMIDLSGP